MKQNPTLLAIETSTDACSVALLRDGNIALRHEIAPREHIRLVLLKIEELFIEFGASISDCDAIAYGRGPGSFTGLRIAAAVAQGLAFGAQLPVIGVSSLQIIAQTALNEALEVTPGKTILVVCDARIHEVYWGYYQLTAAGLATPLIDDQLSLPQNVDIAQQQCDYAAGNGWINYANDLAALTSRILKIMPTSYPSASALLALAKAEWRKGHLQPAAAALPVYLRDKVTHSS